MLYFVLPSLVFHYLNVSSSRLTTMIMEKRAVFLLLITRNFVVSVRGSFFFLWVLMKGCVILL